MPAQPDLEQIISVWWGGAYQSTVLSGLVQEASNFVFGTSTAYALDDFLNIYPKFFGTATAIQGNVVTGFSLVAGIADISNLAPGQFVNAPLVFPNSTLVNSVDASNNAITVSTDALLTGLEMLSVYTAPLVPISVIQVYINLAMASVNYGRWLEQWPLGMSLFIAHYLTLWLQSESQPVSAPGAAAATGLYKGMVASKSAGDVSISYQNMMAGFEDWGAWNLTTYGVQFSTLANIVGWGPVYIW